MSFFFVLNRLCASALFSSGGGAFFNSTMRATRCMQTNRRKQCAITPPEYSCLVPPLALRLMVFQPGTRGLNCSYWLQPIDAVDTPNLV